MAQEDTTPKIGTGHASAMFRQGLAELRGALYADSNVAQPSAYGIYGVATPQEVMQEKQGEPREHSESPSILDERIKQAEQSRDADFGREQEAPQHERE